jgi:hypothetical protein
VRQFVTRSEPDSTNGAHAAKRAYPYWPIFVVVVLVCALAIVLMIRSPGLEVPVPPASSSRIVLAPSPNVLTAVRSLARLETTSFHIERVIELRDEQTHLFGLLKAEDAILLVAAGDVTAGIDLDELRPEDVNADWDARRVTNALPPARVFSTSLDNERTHVYARTTGALASRREDLEGRARMEAERSMHRGAVEAGILVRAEKGAERTLRALLGSLGFRSIAITFRTPAVAHEGALP